VKDERTGKTYEVSVKFVVSLPSGAEPPTPTREAADAAAMAMMGPSFVLSDVEIVVSST
jgi:hypothetical protein